MNSSFPAICHQTDDFLMPGVFLIMSISCVESIKCELNFTVDEVLLFCISIKDVERQCRRKNTHTTLISDTKI